jgi:dTMP kinase
MARIAALEGEVQGALQPDLTIYLDLAVAAGLARIDTNERDRFEREQIAFFERVRDVYLVRARTQQRFRVIDASRPLAAVQADIRVLLQQFIEAAQR